jgi:uncharacterized SAM-binding protein YcdF (DUF218 family)
VPRKRRFILVFLCASFVFVASLSCWIQWGDWPPPQQAPVFANADALVILGGGDYARWQRGAALAQEHPGLPLIVTGDHHQIVRYLLGQGIPKERILHEQAASSTVENARFTKPMLDQIGAQRVILVTNGFHVPRALAVFRKYQPDREFGVSFAPMPDPKSIWDRYAERRERLAALWYALRYGVWSF